MVYLGMVFQLIKMALCILGHGKKGKSLEKGLWDTAIKIIIKGIFWIIYLMERVNWHTTLDLIIKGNSKRDLERGKENTFVSLMGKRDLNTMVSGKTTQFMEMEQWDPLMDKFTQEDLKTIWSKAKGCWRKRMAMHIMENFSVIYIKVTEN